MKRTVDPMVSERSERGHDGELERSASRLSDRRLERRQLLAAGSACLASCAASRPLVGGERTSRLDRLLEAHADLLPERVGAGANHYPMAAEALEALGYERDIDDSWIEGASLYTGELGRVKAIAGEADIVAALGRYDRFGDWLDHFRAALRRGPWRTVVAR